MLNRRVQFRWDKLFATVRWFTGIFFILFSFFILIKESNFEDILSWLFFCLIGLILIPLSFKFIVKVRWILISIIISLIFLNPSITAFRNYSKELDDPKTIYKKETNFILFSIFKKEWISNQTTIHEYNSSELEDERITKSYLGIFGNFFEIKY